MSTTRDLAHLYRSLVLSAGFFLLSLKLLRLLSIILQLLLPGAQGAFNFKLTDTTTKVALDAIAIMGHCLQGGPTSRDTPE